ncbi:MAG: hypothetical protein JO263_04485 [Candidatus Eremiobacteraeota bacterium]|nr:hypothetical protein [Candidatus Eremiobacteraeota bacterium]
MSREFRVHSIPTRAEQVRIIVEVVAILAAGAWALYTFVYEQRIKPLAEAPSFSIATLVEQSAPTNGVVFVTVHKRLENTGNVGIDVAAEALSVYGEQIAKRTQRESRTESATRAQVTADVPRRKVALLFSIAKLRNGAVTGNQNIAFYVPPHSSAEAVYLVAVPARTYPVVLVKRRDFIAKAPITPKVPVRIVRTPEGAYDLKSSQLTGEYDSDDEYPIRPG